MLLRTTGKLIYLSISDSHTQLSLSNLDDLTVLPILILY